jgi:uncharacterized protein (TIGR04255 family)
VEEIPLPNAPLALVVAQVRFPIDSRLADEKTIGAIQDELRSEYPVLRQDREIQIDFSPEGPRAEPQTVWRLGGVDDADWVISISRTFMSLSAKRYTSRADFLARWRRGLEALHSLVKPALADRLGVRYICRIDDPAALGQIPTFLRNEVVGALLVPLGDDVVRERALTETTYRHPDGNMLLARWGTLEANVVYDMSFAPAKGATFVLDLDVATGAPKVFSPGDLTDLARLFAERQYRFFRWAVTDDFLRAYGGEP